MSYHEKLTKRALLMTAVAAVAAVACSDRATAPTPHDEPTTSDFVASGVMYNVLRVPTSGGLRVSRSSFARLELSGTKALVRPSLGDIASSKSDSGKASLHGGESPAFLLPGPGAEKSPLRISLKVRRLAPHMVDGKRITLAFAPDDDKRSNRPPKAMLVLVNDGIAAITEYKYAIKAGAWRATRSRTTIMNEAGAITLVMDNDLSGLIYRPGNQRFGSADRLRNTADRLRAGFLSVIQPDALWAAAPSVEEERCWQQMLAAAAANAYFLAAGVSVTIAQAAEQAARAVLSAATAACIAEPSPATCSAVGGAAAALTAAELGVTKAWAHLVAAAAAVAAADAALSACLYPPDPPETQTGPSGGEGDAGCEEWCQWTITFTEGRMNVHRDFCWCESGDDEQ